MMNTKKKMLLATFCVALMLMLPATSIARKDTGHDIEATTGEIGLEFVVMDSDPAMIKTIDIICYYSFIASILEIIETFNINEIKNVKQELVITEQDLEVAVVNVMDDPYEPLNTGGNGAEDGGSDEGDNPDGEESYPEDMDIISYLSADTLLENFSFDIIKERLGYVSEIALTIQDIRLAKEEFVDNLTPNVTLVEMIEETIESQYGYPFSLWDHLNITTKGYLISLAENMSLFFSLEEIELFGITESLWNTYVVPYIDAIAQVIVTFIYNKLNVEPAEMNEVSIWNRIKTKLKEKILVGFNKDDDDDDKDRPTLLEKLNRILKLARVLKNLIQLTLVVVSYAYMNNTQWEEYEQGINNSITELMDSVTHLFEYVKSIPWKKPVSIEGVVFDPENTLNVENLRVYTQDYENYVLTNETGYFEDLLFITSEKILPFMPHRCKTYAVDEITENTVLVKRWLHVGAFSDGRISLSIDMSESEDTGVTQIPGRQQSSPLLT